MHKKSTLFRVGEITKNIRHFLETQFSHIGVRGEISSFTRHSSGHWYFTLKDMDSQMSVVMFRSSNQNTPPPQVGEEVIAWGRITVYEPRGNYQLLAQKLEKVGDGVLQKNFELIKEKLKKEGLFERKKALPFLPQHIAVITAPSGAALRDVLNVLQRRSKSIRVTLVPALMEGKDSAVSVQLALKQSWKLKNLDLILITRGGGSAESLWTFNDEPLARLAFESPVPLVSAIGHEIDFTIMDFVADLRAPTPSAAAELISQNSVELLEKIQDKKQTLRKLMIKNLQQYKKDILQYYRVLAAPVSKIEDALLKCDDYSSRIARYLQNSLESKKQQLEKSKEILHQLNPLQIMKRGYSLVFKKNQIIHQSSQLKSKDMVQIQFFKGAVQAQVIKKGEVS